MIQWTEDLYFLVVGWLFYHFKFFRLIPTFLFSIKYVKIKHAGVFFDFSFLWIINDLRGLVKYG